jgi:hypothetical protein
MVKKISKQDKEAAKEYIRQAVDRMIALMPEKDNAETRAALTAAYESLPIAPGMAKRVADEARKRGTDQKARTSARP